MSACIRPPMVLMSDRGLALASVVASTSDWHDCLNGFSQDARTGLLIELAKHGLTEDDLHGSINFFSKVGLDDNTNMTHLDSTPGETVELRTEQDILIVLSTVQHPLPSKTQQASASRYRRPQNSTNHNATKQPERSRCRGGRWYDDHPHHHPRHHHRSRRRRPSSPYRQAAGSASSTCTATRPSTPSSTTPTTSPTGTPPSTPSASSKPSSSPPAPGCSPPASTNSRSSPTTPAAGTTRSAAPAHRRATSSGTAKRRATSTPVARPSSGTAHRPGSANANSDTTSTSS